MRYKVAFLDDDDDFSYLMGEHQKEYNERSENHIQAVYFTDPFGFVRCIDDSFDMVFIDIMMPLMDGFAVAENIKKRFPNIVSFMVSDSLREFEDLDSFVPKNNFKFSDVISRYKHLKKSIVKNDLQIRVRAADYGYVTT